MVQKQRHVKTDVVGVEKEAFIFLTELSRKQRGCKPLAGDQQEKLWRRVRKNKDGLREIEDGDMGGGIGNYYSGWTSWKVEDIRKILSDAGLEWTECGTREYDAIDVGF